MAQSVGFEIIIKTSLFTMNINNYEITQNYTQNGYNMTYVFNLLLKKE